MDGVCVPNVHTTVYCAQPGWEGGYAWGGRKVTTAGASCMGGLLAAVRGLHNKCMTAWWRGRRPR